ncbi:MAG TPA: hypothetical protein VLH85_08050 [Levilinea sp.]|nr:hypothetical protein [Levilinea sp.]
MDDERLVFNGIDAATGGYLLPPLPASAIISAATGTPMDEKELNELKWFRQYRSEGHYGVVEGVDPKQLSQAGWGVIFSAGAGPAIKDALKELLDWRKMQATAVDERFYKDYSGPDGYRPGETKQAFLSRHGAGPGPADPKKVPYYLLIVGDPQAIPYRFQYQLDVQYAVGRIHFDMLDDYTAYAHSVVTAEKEGLALPKHAVFFGTANPGDRATQLSASQLVAPLAEKMAIDQPGWQIETVLSGQATKSELGRRHGGDATPALLFTASHGVGFPNGDTRQFAHQGALLCQDWPGPDAWQKAIPEDFYFSGGDVSHDARLLGLIAFTFACYGAGTPEMDEFSQQAFKQPKPVAPHAFLARLPQRLLSHPNGGALAVIGHVERAWGCSFLWNRTSQTPVFESSLKRLAEGHPVGSAFEFFNERYSELSSDLSVMIEDVHFGKAPDEMAIASMWTANNDARNYVVLGDPAVRLMVAEQKENLPERPVIALQPRPQPAAPAPPPPAPAAVESLTDESVDYALVNFREMQSGVKDSLTGFVNKLGSFLANALDDAATLEVATYASDRMNEVKYEDGRFTGARLRALTRIKIDGDALVCIPEEDGELDTAVWDVHMQMLQQAQSSRIEFLKTVISAATGLVDLVKPG